MQQGPSNPTSPPPVAQLITIAPAPRRPIILLHHIPTHHHGHLTLPQHLPQRRVPRIDQLDRLQLRLVPYPRIAASVEQDLDNRGAGRPVGLGERVCVAHGFVEGQVAFDAVGELDLDAFLVEQDVEDLVCSISR